MDSYYYLLKQDEEGRWGFDKLLDGIDGTPTIIASSDCLYSRERAERIARDLCGLFSPLNFPLED